jgi:glycosyltransferase involved in cell wall biosynthesis
MGIKNIIVVNDYDYVQGGASSVAIEMANSLENYGFNVTFFCGVSDLSKSKLISGVKRIVCNKYDFLNNPHHLRSAFACIYSFSVKHKMEECLSGFSNKDTIVMIHGWTKALSSSFLVPCKKGKYLTVLTGHDYFSICANGGLFNYRKNRICKKTSKKFSCHISNCDSRNFLFKMLRQIRFFVQDSIVGFTKKIDYLITISDLSEEKLSPYFAKSKIVRIYNPTSIDQKEKRICAENNSYLIYIGRLDKEKGVAGLCKAINQTNEKLIVVGDGAEFSFLTEEYRNNSNIVFTGWIEHQTAINYLKGAKALLFPGLCYEGAPLTIFESLSLGVPVIVSELNAGKQFINSSNGWIYNPYNEKSLLNIVTVLTPEALNKKSVGAYENYWQNPYTKKRYTDSICKFIQGL